MKWASVLTLGAIAGLVQAETIHTKVAILGGGVSGISASLNLTLNGVHDFVLVEARDVLGGRAQDVKFGNNATIELGCNWVQALGKNPINILAQKYNLKTVSTDYDDVVYINHHGKKVNGSKEYQRFSDASDKMGEHALERAKNKQVDITMRTGLSLSGWIPESPLDDTIEYFGIDYETGDAPELCSDVFGALNDESNYNGDFGPDLEEQGDRMNIDPRGFKYIFLEEAKRVFKKNDPRLKLGSTVKSIAYDKNGVTITTDKDIIKAEYAITTFSLGVLQHRDVKWVPELPDWKLEGIFGFRLTTYTKIFMNFPRQFWDENQYTLYVNPNARGLYSAWQNMNAKGYFPQGTKDNVFMVTVTQDNSYRVESMTDAQVKAELMTILRKMYGDDIPEPTDFVFPRWHSNPLFRGSYSNWPIGELDQHHENLKAPLHNRVFFAGEATSRTHFGYLQGGWLSGEHAAIAVSQCIKDKCPRAMYYPKIVNSKQSAQVIKREVVV